MQHKAKKGQKKTRADNRPRDDGKIKDGHKLGTVTETLPNTMFRVQYDDGTENIAIVSGKMRKFRIRILIGDTVEAWIDQYGGKDRIVKRLINRK